LPLYPLLIPGAAYGVEPLLLKLAQLAAWLRPVPAAVARAALRRISPLKPVFREQRNWTYLAYIGAAAYWLSGIELLTALLLPVTAFAIMRLTRADIVHRVTGSLLWVAALARVAAAGSRSPEALHDPLFWGLAAAVMLGISAVTGRWPLVATACAAVAGACTMIATLLPVFPDFEANFRVPDVTIVGESLIALGQRFGPLGALFLVGAWLQGIMAGRAPDTWRGRIVAAARSALLTALVLSLAGTEPATAVDPRLALVALGMLLGLVEAKARARAPAPCDATSAPRA
jgi:hypothetical protein